MGASGLGYVVIGDVHSQGSVLTGPIAKFLPEEARQELLAKTGAKIGDAIFFSADAKADRAANLAGYARTRIGRDLGLIN